VLELWAHSGGIPQDLVQLLLGCGLGAGEGLRESLTEGRVTRYEVELLLEVCHHGCEAVLLEGRYGVQVLQHFLFERALCVEGGYYTNRGQWEKRQAQEN
jgi:hypothetical protein